MRKGPPCMCYIHPTIPPDRPFICFCFLHAAAPDLLAACEAITDCFAGSFYRMRMGDGTTSAVTTQLAHAIETAVAAIAKARGVRLSGRPT